MTDALFTHHHYGWRKHTETDASEASLLAALLLTHDFLLEYAGKYRTEITRFDDKSFDGTVGVYWDADEPKTFLSGGSLLRGDYWFSAFEFNVADEGACRYCGGTGRDHYRFFAHCWACDGTAVQLRQSMPRGFLHKPTKDAPPKFHEEYAEYVAARGEAAAA